MEIHINLTTAQQRALKPTLDLLEKKYGQILGKGMVSNPKFIGQTLMADYTGTGGLEKLTKALTDATKNAAEMKERLIAMGLDIPEKQNEQEKK